MITDKAVLDGLVCPYCGKPTEYVADTEIYNGKTFGSMFYRCRPCDAYVGCHKPNPTQALGRLANKELREAKILAHYYFDQLWRKKISQGNSKSHSRKKAYGWLAKQLGIDFKYCHIGMFDVAECERVVEVCKPFVK